MFGSSFLLDWASFGVVMAVWQLRMCLGRAQMGSAEEARKAFTLSSLDRHRRCWTPDKTWFTPKWPGLNSHMLGWGITFSVCSLWWLFWVAILGWNSWLSSQPAAFLSLCLSHKLSCLCLGQNFCLDWCKQPDVGLPKPDLILFLRLSPEEAAERGNFGHERYETSSFQEKVLQSFCCLMEDKTLNWKVRN